MLTVLIATYNGARTLPRVLEAFRRLEEPAGGWNLVVVDNGSTDATQSILRSFARQLPLKSCQEDVRGKNAALNTGLGQVTGDVVVFTDDDVLPHPDWLVEMRKAADTQTGYEIFGGPIQAHWESPGETPLFDPHFLGSVYGITDPAWPEGEIGPGYVFGANMAIRSRVLEAGFRFNTDVGPRGTDYAMGSESELILRLVASGFKCWHRKSAVVEHIIRDFQMKSEWILHRGRLAGRGLHRRLEKTREPYPIQIFGVPAYLFWHAVKHGAAAARGKLRGDSAGGFEARWRLNRTLGQMTESRIIARERREGRYSVAARRSAS